MHILKDKEYNELVAQADRSSKENMRCILRVTVSNIYWRGDGYKIPNMLEYEDFADELSKEDDIDVIIKKMEKWMEGFKIEVDRKEDGGDK